MATSTGHGPLNKVSINMDERLYGYLLGHTRETEVLRELRQVTADAYPRASRMQISPDQGAFMHWLVTTLRATRTIEVGVFTGYSSIATATALPPGGKLLACDPDAEALAVARRFWAKAGVSDKARGWELIEEHIRPAGETLAALLQGGQAGQYDFAFVDADKRGYAGYYEQLLQLVRPGGVIAFDNMLWGGRVADSSVTDLQTQALRDLNDTLLADSRVLVSIVPVGDGIALCTKR